MRVPSFVGTAVAAVAGILFPPLCLVCSVRLDSPRGTVCPACRAGMRRIGRPHPLVLEAESRVTADGTIERFQAAYLFEREGPVQAALHLLKYSGMHSVGAVLGGDLAEVLRSDPAFAPADLLIPVPLHAARLRERGYNQAERICAGIAAVTGAEVGRNVVVRSRNTPSQTSLGQAGREENVRGAFRVTGRGAGIVRGRTVVIVDDVLTTGSTVLACARPLRLAGAAGVLAATVAVADRAG